MSTRDMDGPKGGNELIVTREASGELKIQSADNSDAWIQGPSVNPEKL